MMTWRGAKPVPTLHPDAAVQELFFSLPLIPSARLCPVHVDAVGEHREGLRCELQPDLPGLCRPGPEEGALFQPLHHQPHPGAVPVEHLDEPLPLVGEDKERAALRGFLEPFGHQGAQRIDARTHVDGIERNEDLQTAREAQHDVRRA
jgi:hypothetical protein